MKRTKMVEYLECETCNTTSGYYEKIDGWSCWPAGWTSVNVKLDIKGNEFIVGALIQEDYVDLTFCPKCTIKLAIY